VKYFCKNEEDLMSHVKEQKKLVAAKRNNDKRNKLSCSRLAKHAEKLKTANASSTNDLVSVCSNHSTSNINEESLNEFIPIEKQNLAITAVEKVNFHFFNSCKEMFCQVQESETGVTQIKKRKNFPEASKVRNSLTLYALEII